MKEVRKYPCVNPDGTWGEIETKGDEFIKIVQRQKLRAVNPEASPAAVTPVEPAVYRLFDNDFRCQGERVGIKFQVYIAEDFTPMQDLELQIIGAREKKVQAMIRAEAPFFASYGKRYRLPPEKT